MAFCDLKGNQDVAEEFLKCVFKNVLKNCPEDMEFFNKYIDKTVLETAEKIINNKFERITYTNAINLLENSNKQFNYKAEWGIDLQSEHERYLAEEVFKSPVIVTDYPATTKAFFGPLAENGRLAAVEIKEGNIGKATIYQRYGKEFTKKYLFDAYVPVFDGFKKIQNFNF